MKPAHLFVLLFVAALAVPAFAGEKKSADYEVHEWGFVFANPPTDKNPLDDFLKSLPGKIRQSSTPGPQPERDAGSDADPGASAGAPGNGGGQPADPGPSGPGATPSTPPPTGNPGVGSGTDRGTPGGSRGRGGMDSGGSGQSPRTPPDQGGTPPPTQGGTPPQASPWNFNDNPWRWGEPFMWFYSRNPLQIQLKVDLGVFKPLCWWPQGIEEGNTLLWKRLNLSKFMPSGKRLDDMGDGTQIASWIAKARDVNASFVGSGNKVEKFLMYEFLGLYWSDLRVRRDSAGLWVENCGEKPIRGVYLLTEELAEGKAYYLPTLDNDQTAKRVDSEGGFEVVNFRAHACKTLVQAGLNLEEALCLLRVLTAQEVFFKSKGVRALHLMDREIIETVSKLEFTPEPTDVKRVWLMMMWDACSYNGISTYLNDTKTYGTIVDAVKNSGGRQDVVDGFLKRIASQRAKEGHGKSRG